jgi:hypothetical protein
VVSFTPQPLYPRGKIPRYPLVTRLGGPQNWSGRREEEKILDPTRTRNPTLGRPARSQSLYRVFIVILTVILYILIKLHVFFLTITSCRGGKPAETSNFLKFLHVFFYPSSVLDPSHTFLLVRKCSCSILNFI